MKTVIIGDIGGQTEVFLDVLKRVGISDDFRVPAGLRIIQIGDLARMSNEHNIDSVACLQIADSLLRNNPGQWFQLLGNHESPFIGGPYPETWVGRQAFHDQSRDIVTAWWNEGLAKLAVGIDTHDGPALITHAGITRGYYRNVLHARNPHDAVSAINSIVKNRDYHGFYEIGAVNFGLEPNVQSDFLWAATGAELLPSWHGHDMGFHQIHGHDTALISWDKPVLRNDLPDEYLNGFSIDEPRRLTSLKTPEGWSFRSVDWVLKEALLPDTNDWGLVELHGKIFI